jgi:hypothetical protein
MKTCEHMVTNHQELGKPLDVGTEEHILLEDWFDRNKYVPFDDVEDEMIKELFLDYDEEYSK